MRAAIYQEETGQIVKVVTGPEDFCAAQCRAGQNWLAVGDVSDATHYVEAGVAAEKAERPSQNHRFDYATKEWIDPRSLQDLKDARWAEVRRERDSAEFGGFTWDGSRFDSDALSQQRITGAVTLSMMNSEFSIDWTLADNTVRSLNAADMIAVGVALGQHVNACHERVRVLRGEIDEATTTAELSLEVSELKKLY